MAATVIVTTVFSGIVAAIAWQTGLRAQHRTTHPEGFSCARHAWDEPVTRGPDGESRATGLSAASQLIRSSSHLPAVIVVGILALAASLVLIAVTSRGGSAVSAGRPTEPVALEIVSLEHEANGTRMTIRGVVRNPTSGAELHHLSAVVVVMDQNGGFLASGRATIDAGTLVPGSESTFLVTVPRGGEAGRYRISFSSDDRVVPHLDRRARGPVDSVARLK
jgi:hypothetical protein